MVGIVDTADRTSSEIIESAKSRFRDYYLLKKKKPFSDTSTYPGETWFKYVPDRKPLLIIYLVDIRLEENQEARSAEFERLMEGIPSVGFAIGFPENENAPENQYTVYRANKVYNWFERYENPNESEEE